ncbi:MAG TPA: hypothetical protein DEA22_13570 [Blastocatellia bacterium]|nr:hypothetical protein [Blastocatellia bacterium]
MRWESKSAFTVIAFTIVFSALAYGTVHQSIVAFFYLLTAIAAIFIAIGGFRGKFRIEFHPMMIPLAGAAIYGFIQVIPFGQLAEIAGVRGIEQTISLDPFQTRLASIHFTALLIFFWVLLSVIDDEARLRKLAGIIGVFGFLYAFFAILQSVLSPEKIYGIYESRFASPYGSFVSRHNYAAYILMALSIPLGLLFTGAIEKDKRLLLITAAAIMGSSLLLSGSRGGLVSAVAAVIFLLILTTGNESRKKFLVKAGLASLLGIAILIGAIFAGGENTLTRVAETASSTDVSTGRWHIWDVTYRIIAEGFPFGTGIGAYGIAFTRFDTNGGMDRVEQAHNDFLQAVSDAGVIGIILGGIFLYWFIRTGIKALKASKGYRRGIAVGAFAGCFGVVVHSFFDFVLHTTAISVLFLSLLALLIKSAELPQDEKTAVSMRKSKRHRTRRVEYLPRQSELID